MRGRSESSSAGWASSGAAPASASSATASGLPPRRRTRRVTRGISARRAGGAMQIRGEERREPEDERRADVEAYPRLALEVEHRPERRDEDRRDHAPGGRRHPRRAVSAPREVAGDDARAAGEELLE